VTPWRLLDSAQIPGDGTELRLYARGDEHSITIAGSSGELMGSRMHGSEDALAQLACARIAQRPAPRVLIGGLGLGFTLAAALRHLGANAEVVVAELVPAVVQWNRTVLGHHAGHPLRDARVAVREGDVALLLKAAAQAWDAILLDVDNGPEGLTRHDNNWLYSPAGLKAAFQALRPDGVLAVWSAGPDAAFGERLRQLGFEVDERRVRAHATRKGALHTLWLAGRGP
jgi:Spermidine synthase